MRTETVVGSSERGTAIRFTPEQYDALPLTTVAWVDSHVTGRNRDRMAVAHALLLFPFISGRFQPSQGCGVDIALPLRNLFSSRNVLIEGVAMAPARIPSGTRTALLCDGSYRSAALTNGHQYDLVFRISESAFTTSIGPRNAIVSSNFGLFAHDKGQLNSTLPSLAAAVLFAEDLGIARLILPVHTLTPQEADLLKHLSALLAAVNLVIETPILDLDFERLSELIGPPVGLTMFFAERHEHRKALRDWPDFWLAALCSSKFAGNHIDAKRAAMKLWELSQAGFPLSHRELDLLSQAMDRQEQTTTANNNRLKSLQ